MLTILTSPSFEKTFLGNLLVGLDVSKSCLHLRHPLLLHHEKLCFHVIKLKIQQLLLADLDRKYGVGNSGEGAGGVLTL